MSLLRVCGTSKFLILQSLLGGGRVGVKGREREGGKRFLSLNMQLQTITVYLATIQSSMFIEQILCLCLRSIMAEPEARNG